MQKERTHQKSIAKTENEPAEYIPRKCLCQLIYRELEHVKGLTQEQYEATIKKYSVLGRIYSALREFHRIVFSQQSTELEAWIAQTERLQIVHISFCQTIIVFEIYTIFYCCNILSQTIDISI